MLDAINHVRLDIGDLGKEQFLVDGKTQRAVLESIIVIGEAANKVMGLDPSIGERNPVLWQHLRDAYDMRIVLTHEYFRVDAGIVWTTVENSLPKLEKLLVIFANEYRGGDGGPAGSLDGEASPVPGDPSAGSWVRRYDQYPLSRALRSRSTLKM